MFGRMSEVGDNIQIFNGKQNYFSFTSKLFILFKKKNLVIYQITLEYYYFNNKNQETILSWVRYGAIVFV